MKKAMAPRLSVFIACTLVTAFLSLASQVVLAADQKMTKARIGGVASLLYLPVYVGIEQGYFTKHNVEVELIQTNTPVPALLAGEIDYLMRSADDATIVTARGKPIPAVVMIQQRNSLTFDVGSRLKSLVEGKHFPENLDALKGKISTVGITARGTGSDLFLKEIFRSAGMEEGRDYSMVVIGSGANLVQALQAGRVDAVNLWPPFSQAAYAENVAVAVVQQAKNEGPETTKAGAGIAVLTNPSYLKNNEQGVRDFVAATEEAMQFSRDYAKNKSVLVSIAKKYTGVVDEAVLDSAIQDVAALAYPGVDCAKWSNTAKNLKNGGFIEKEPPCSDVVALNFAPKGPTGP